ncbi:MAG: hypothetical protein ACJ74J_11440 [Blastocatellia bacterium]
MMIQRSATLRITTIRRLCVRAEAYTFRARCQVCNCEVEMLPADGARAVLAIDLGAFKRLLDAGVIHSILTVSGSLWVCKESLIAGQEKQ